MEVMGVLPIPNLDSPADPAVLVSYHLVAVGVDETVLTGVLDGSEWGSVSFEADGGEFFSPADLAPALAAEPFPAEVTVHPD